MRTLEYQDRDNSLRRLQTVAGNLPWLLFGCSGSVVRCIICPKAQNIDLLRAMLIRLAAPLRKRIIIKGLQINRKKLVFTVRPSLDDQLPGVKSIEVNDFDLDPILFNTRDQCSHIGRQTGTKTITVEIADL